MKIGILITTFNRPNYLQQTLESISQADLLGANILIVDDCSVDVQTQTLIKPYRTIRNIKNLSIRHSLQIGFDRLAKDGCTLLVNLDSDVIVRRDFLSKLLELHRQFSDQIVTGFNTLTKSRTGKVRHPIFSSHDGYVTKRSIGGVNMAISVNTYETIVRPALVEAQRTKDHWDKIACRISTEQGKLIIVSKPSVIQHIGFNSAMGHKDNPDAAQDFVSSFKPKLCILQPHGIGDVIFCQTLVRGLGDYDITWPVQSQFIEGLQAAYPDINWMLDTKSPVPLTIKTDSRCGDYRAIPIRWSDQILRVPYMYVMKAKYNMYKLDFKDWKRRAMWKRDSEKEEKLFNLLNLKPKQYVLKNLTFLSNSSRKIEIDVEGIEMREIPGYSLFDWAKVFENAKEIHTVSTSILYILDLLNTCSVNVYVRRPNEKDHSFYNYIFTDKKFIYR
jgi:glycosyltransferase involved in cell wall biosynthesis